MSYEEDVLSARVLALEKRMTRLETATGNEPEPEPEPVLGTVLDGSDQGSAAVDDPDVPPYDQWSRNGLHTELRARGLAATGDKAALVDRLERYDSES